MSIKWNISFKVIDGLEVLDCPTASLETGWIKGARDDIHRDVGFGKLY